MRPIAVLLVASLTFPLAAANDWCVVDVDSDLTVDAAGETYYVINELCQPDCVFSIWLVHETNGIPGLQLDLWRPNGRPCYPIGTPGDEIVL